MGELIAWAAIGGALALFTQRKGLAVLTGVVTAIAGTVLKVTALAVLVGAVIGARPGQGSGPVPLFRAVALAVFAACLVLVVTLAHMLTRGGRPE